MHSGVIGVLGAPAPELVEKDTKCEDDHVDPESIREKSLMSVREAEEK